MLVHTRGARRVKDDYGLVSCIIEVFVKPIDWRLGLHHLLERRDFHTVDIRAGCHKRFHDWEYLGSMQYFRAVGLLHEG
jgi:hypothetical protein